MYEHLTDPGADSLRDAAVGAGQRPEDAVQNGRFAGTVVPDPRPKSAAQVAVIAEGFARPVGAGFFPGDLDVVSDQAALRHGGGIPQAVVNARVLQHIPHIVGSDLAGDSRQPLGRLLNQFFER